MTISQESTATHSERETPSSGAKITEAKDPCGAKLTPGSGHGWSRSRRLSCPGRSSRLSVSEDAN